MRFYQFIAEDRLSVTVNNFGRALLNRLQKQPDNTLPGDLDNADAKSLVTLIQSQLSGPIAKYLPWVVREYSTGNIRRFEDIGSRIAPLLADYVTASRRNDFPATAKDIMRLSADQFEYEMTTYKPPEPRLTNRGKSKTFLDNSSVRIIIPEDEPAACYYGQGTRWCTAGKNHNQFNRYNAEGPLYILLPKQPKHNGEKYQLYFGSNPSQAQFMNEHDEPVDLHWLLTERFPELYQVFAKTDPEVVSEDNILFTDRRVLTKIARIIANYISDLYHDYAVENGVDDDDYEYISSQLLSLQNDNADNVIKYTNSFVEDYFNNTNDLPEINVPDLPYVYSQLLDYDYSDSDIGNLLQERLWITDNKKNVNGTVLGKAGKWIIGATE